MEMKNILLTGSEGFIGSNVKSILVKNKFKVYCLVRKKKKNSKNIFYIKKNFLNKKCDVVIHCAAKSPENNKFHRNDYNENISITKKIIKYSLKYKPKKIIFLSSLSVHGKIISKKVNENTKILNPDLYGKSKLFCEKMLKKLSDKVSIVSIRLPGVIGKYSVRNWLTLILMKIKNNQSVDIYNLDQKFNNLIHVKELSLFIHKLINHEFNGYHNLYLGTKNPIKIQSIINIFKYHLKSSIKLNVLGIKKNNFLIDYSNAKKNFNYKPTLTKKDIIRFIKENK